jgi:hypothetical protein
MTTQTPSRTLKAALWYANHGWHVFPCRKAAKTPLIEHGRNDTTTDEATIRHWWTRWPEANIGIATGHESGIFVLDDDPKHGGPQSVEALERTHGPLPPTVHAITGSGGGHRVFAHPGAPVRIRNSVQTLGPGLDIRGDGGYIVAAPSLHPNGTPYAWRDGHSPREMVPARAPEWLLSLITASPSERHTGANGHRVIAEGERNDTLFRDGCAMRTRGFGYEAILAALLLENEHCCRPPLDTDEVETIAASAARYDPTGGASGAGAGEDHQALPAGETASAGGADETIARLAALSAIEYDRTREAEAQTLGIRVSTLDRIVAHARGNGDDPAGQGHAITFIDDDETAWDEPVDGACVLDAIAATYRRYVVLPPGGADMLALWTLHSHAHHVATVSPLVALQSPQKRCGKTTTLQILSGLVARALPCSNITPAAIFRTVERYGPTLILDEADTYLRPEHDDLRGILNSGHTRATAYVIRTVGDDHEPRRFATWCPKAIALIGGLPSTLADRSITLRLYRKAPSETVERWRIDHADSLADLRRMARRWAQDRCEALLKVDPKVPASVHDRAADNWRPLLAIADVAGSDWPERARRAIRAIEPMDGEDDDLNGLLLRDLRDLFATRETDKLTSADICEHLASLEDRPWPTLSYGKPMNAHRLSRMLGNYGVTPKQIRIGERTLKGYRREDLDDAFTRYIPPSETETSKHGTPGEASEAKANRNMTCDVSVSKNLEPPALTRDVSMF